MNETQKRATTMHKNNSGVIAKTKVNEYKKGQS